jgi:DNA polymerase-3 subunit gamma/tau
MSEQRFLVTARKYRPQRFDELVAQEHVTATLKNAVRLERLAHAYLFTGPRGVGKTTAARVLAKAINCTAPPGERSDGSEPCRTCESCRSFEEGRNLNIIEIDAASNNGVEDIRELRETVRVPPQGNRRKVYIVDEVHMLSKQAFNALLKTLEEPPPHVLFIFATTEPHKVLPTIQSRCQRFDFRRIPVADIVEHLREICRAESIQADEGSLMLIARRGDGALRDALSVFDQAVSVCGERLSQPELVEALGAVDEDLYFQVTDRITATDTAGMLDVVDTVVRSGYDLQEFLDGLAEHLRNLLVARTMPDARLIEAAEATRTRYRESARELDETTILRLMSIVDQAMDQVRASRQPRLRLELALLRMATLPSSVDLRKVLDRLGGAPAMPGPAARPASAQAAPARSRQPTRAERSAASEPTAAGAPVEPPPSRRAPESPVVGVPAGGGSEPVPEHGGSEPAPGPTVSGEEPPPPAGPTLFDAGPAPPVAGIRTATRFGRPALEVSVSPSLSPPAEGAETDVSEPDSPGSAEPAWWPQYVERVKAERIHVGALLRHATATIAEDGALRIEAPDDFHVRVLREETDLLRQALVPGDGPRARDVRIVRSSTPSTGTSSADDAPDAAELVRELCEEYPALRLLMERFGGEIVW